MPTDDYETHENESLDEIEASEYYASMQKKTQKKLEEQRALLIASGLILGMYALFSSNLEPGKVMSRETEKRLEEYITMQATKRITGITEGILPGADFRLEAYKFLYTTMQKGGTMELYSMGLSETFGLTNKMVKDKIYDRISTLCKGIDQTTAKKFAGEILSAMKQNLPQEKLVERLTAIAKDVSEKRAALIVRTESNAALQFIRKQIAVKNGCQYKVRMTTKDERVCPVCSLLQNEQVGIDETFGDLYNLPPIHPMCRCWIDYLYDESSSEEILKSDRYTFYETTGYDKYDAYCPTVLRAGGEGYVGKEGKTFAMFFDAMKEIGSDGFSRSKIGTRATINKMTEAMTREVGLLNLFEIKVALKRKLASDLLPKIETLSDFALLLISARYRLSDGAFAKLIRKLGVRGTVKSK